MNPDENFFYFGTLNTKGFLHIFVKAKPTNQSGPRSTNFNPSPGFVGFGGWWELEEGERVQKTCIGLAGWMMIGGGSRRKNRGQLDGWGSRRLSRDPPRRHISSGLWTLYSSPNSHHPPNPTNPGGGQTFVDLHTLESTYINRKKFHCSRAWIPRTHFVYLILNPNKNRPLYQSFKIKIIY